MYMNYRNKTSGKIPPRMSDETREKIRQAKLKYKPTSEHIENARLGILKHYQENKPILDLRRVKRTCRQCRKKLAFTNQTGLCLVCFRRTLKGPLSTNWRGGITEKNLAIRTSWEYKEWRKAVFERDDYTCQFCFERGGNIVADHIKSFRNFPKLRFDINNGRVLCVECHRKTDTYGGNARSSVDK